MTFSSTLCSSFWVQDRKVCSPQPAQPLVPLNMLVKGCSPCFISLLGHLGVSRAGYGARDACCPWCAAQSRSKGRHWGSPNCHSWIPIAARLCRCPKNGMRLGPAPAGDGPPASSTWLGQRDMSPVGTSVVAFHLARAALPGEHRTHVPSRWAAPAEDIPPRVSGRSLRMLPLPQRSSSSGPLGAASRERRLGAGGAHDAGEKRMYRLRFGRIGVSMQPCPSAGFGGALPQRSLGAQPALGHVGLSCSPPQCVSLQGFGQRLSHPTNRETGSAP